MSFTTSIARLVAAGLALALVAVATPALAKKRQGGKGVREKHLTREHVIRKDTTNIDLDGVDVTGGRKEPMQSLISSGKAEKSYDFVKIRTRWHPEMVQSASALNTP